MWLKMWLGNNLGILGLVTANVKRGTRLAALAAFKKFGGLGSLWQ
jgi:hypothetical protein